MDCILNAVEHFCVMNDIVINLRKINKFKSPEKNVQANRIWTHQYFNLA
jgi:hypothetical protein